MKSSSRSMWMALVGVLVLASCKGDGDAKPVDPLDDPWIDAIDTGDEEPTMAAGAGSPDAVVAIAEAGSPGEAPPTTAVLAAPSAGEAEPGSGTAHAPATDSSSAKAPAAAPEQPIGEAPPVDEQAAEPAPPPVAEPAASPSAEPAKPESPAPITAADFHGSYRYAGGSSQREDLAAAIEATVSQLAKPLHGIARKRLTQANPVDGTLDVVIAGDKITTTFESGFTVTCVLDGAAVNTSGREGEKLAVRVRSKGSKLVQTFQGKDGARTIVYVLSADRKKLTVHHKITADRLPEPLTFQLSYARK